MGREGRTEHRETFIDEIEMEENHDNAERLPLENRMENSRGWKL